MELNLSGNLGGKIDEMLSGSVAGDVSFITPTPEPPVLDTLNVTENGTYTPPTGTDGYNEVNVNVPVPEPPVLDTLNVTENGTYTPPTGTDGYNEVNVNVPVPILDSLNVTQNGTYTPSSGTDGYNEVIVNVPTPTIVLNADNIQICTDQGYYMEQQPLNNIITESGYYMASLKVGNNSWNTIINYDGTSDSYFDINYGNNRFSLHLTPSSIGSQNYGGSYVNGYIKLSKIYIDNSQIY